MVPKNARLTTLNRKFIMIKAKKSEDMQNLQLCIYFLFDRPRNLCIREEGQKQAKKTEINKVLLQEI